MKTAYAMALLALICLPASAWSQAGGNYRGSTPVEQFPGDPVQGGALKEHRVPSHQSYGSSSERPGVVRSHPGAEIDTSMMPPPAPATELVAQSRNGVNWLCGGVGEQEVSYMKNEAKRYDMMLTFAARNGAYLADVNVSVADQSGRDLLQTECNGPIMLVDLPRDGDYRIRAEVDGHEVKRTVQVQDGQGQRRHVVMTWPLSVAGMQAGVLSSGDSGEILDEEEDPVR